jgi:hypothetical protein
MDTKMSSWQGIRTSVKDAFAEPANFYTLVVSLSISILLIFEVIYNPLVKLLSSAGFYWLEENYPLFVTAGDRAFSQGFVEWFGTFYGFFLPLLLVRAWEQLDKADREFDREADSIKILLEDAMLLEDEFIEFKQEVVQDLNKYTNHVLTYYKVEHNVIERKKEGDDLLQGIRVGYKRLIYRGGGHLAGQLEPMTTELLGRLNEAIDVRGDRIAVFGERLFQSLKLVAIVTSIIWLIPFYFLSLELGVLGNLFKFVVTFLIIFILTIIDDLDEPFKGFWKVNIENWKEILKESASNLSTLSGNVSSESAEKDVNNLKNKENKIEATSLSQLPKIEGIEPDVTKVADHKNSNGKTENQVNTTSP